MPTDPGSLTLDLLIEYIARGHAFNKHLEGNDPDSYLNGKNAFRETTVSTAAGSSRLGPDLHIQTPDDLRDYIRRMIDSADTKGFVDPNGSVHMFNSGDKTYLIVNPKDPDFGTIYRYEESEANFKRALSNAQLEARASRKTVTAFDNAAVPGTARKSIQGVVDYVRNNADILRGKIMRDDPGIVTAINNPSSKNLAKGMSADYRAFADSLDKLDIVRAALDRGNGFIAAIDEKGRPSQMFLLDEAKNTVTQIKGREIIVHTFDNLPEAERAATARQFFELNRPEAAQIIDGGYDGVIKAFQVENPGKLPLIGSHKGQVLTNLRTETIHATTDIPYTSLDDAARALLGLSEVEAKVFNAVPANLSAELLQSVTPDSQVIGALKELSAAKELALAKEEGGVKFFAETFGKLDGPTQKGVLEALQIMSKAPLAETAQAAKITAQGAHALSDLAELAKALKLSRLGLNTSKAGIITTVVTTGIAVTATNYANAAVLNIADQLHASGQLSAPAYQEYKELMSSVGPMLTGQSADPFITAIPGTFIVDRIAHNRFQEFSDKYKLPQNIHEMLSPAMFSGNSVRGQIGDNTLKIIPDSPDGAPEILRKLIEAKQQLTSANSQYFELYQKNNTYISMMNASVAGQSGIPAMGFANHLAVTNLPDIQEAQAQVDAAKAIFQNEFDKLLSNTEGAKTLAGLLNEDQLLEIIRATGKFNSQGQNPLIDNYVNAEQANASWYDLKGHWNNMQNKNSAEQALRERPEIMRGYLANIFVPNKHLQPAQYDLTESGELTLDDGTKASFTSECIIYDAQPNFIFIANAFENMKAGQKLAPEDEKEIRHYLNNPQTDADKDIIELIKDRYPEQFTKFIDNQTTNKSIDQFPVIDNTSMTFPTKLQTATTR